VGVYKKGRSWLIDYYWQGRRIREVAGTTKTQAEKALQTRKADILRGKFSIDRVKPSPRFEDFARDYLEWSRANKRSWRRDEVLVKHLVGFFRGRTLADISPWLVERYRQERRPGLRPATLNREVACLKRMFSLAVQWSRVGENPAKSVKLWREDNRQERVLTPEEIERLLATCTGHCRAMVLLGLHTGMRLGEILGLTWDHLDLSRGVITLVHTKNGKVRRVPLNETARGLLQSRSREGPYVFGGERPYGSIKTAFRSACRRAGIGRIRFHDLRHTWATYAVLGGVDLRTVQELGGWSSLALVERYSHPTPDARRQAARVVEDAYGHQTDTVVQSETRKPLTGL